MWFFAIVYVVEGIGQAKSGIVWQPLTHYLKQSQGWGPTEVSVSLAVVDLPWVIKPLYGLISDFLPLFGSRRRAWLIVASLAGALAFAGVGLVSEPRDIVPALVLTAIAMAISSTLCGALLVENGQRTGRSGAFVNQQWLFFSLALIVSSLLGGQLAERLEAGAALHVAAWIAAAAPLAVLPALVLVPEAPARIDLGALRARFAALLRALRSRVLWLIAGYLFCYYFSPGFGTALYFHMTDTLGFSQGFVGLLSSVNAAGWIAGGLLYAGVLKRLAPKAMLRLSIAAGVATTLAYLGLRDPASAVAIYFFTGIANMLATIATLSLAAEVCPEGAEGFGFAALMSVINLATPLSDSVGSALYEHVFESRLAPSIVVSAAFTAVAWPLLRFMPPPTRRPPTDADAPPRPLP
jgi:predicted MFS family arabinose efflux permease